MSKSEGQKMKLFALKEILEQETDANHGIPMKRILELLDARGIKAERKSIYSQLSKPMQKLSELREFLHSDVVFRSSHQSRLMEQLGSRHR